ncbi:MAG TPA: GGDEF domain-containing protein [bacterium]|nr:GGDEF domain-containing protein [bacterium]
MNETTAAFLRKYRIEFIIISLVSIGFFHTLYVSLKAPVHRFLFTYNPQYLYFILFLAAALITVALISYPKIYKLKILISGFALASFIVCYSLILATIPESLKTVKIFGLSLDFKKMAFRDASFISVKFLITILSFAMLAAVLAPATIAYSTGKNISWSIFGGIILIFLVYIYAVSSKYAANDTTRFATQFMTWLNKFFIPINLLVFCSSLIISLFNVEDEHNYGSILVAVHSVFFYMALNAQAFYPVKLILPVAALILLSGMFVHWLNCLHHKAHYDPLLKIFNRQYMDAVIAGIADIKLGNELSVLMCDLDYFKKVNDTHGHAAGDAVLQKTAHIIRETALPEGITCRYGGEEIVVFLRGKTGDEAAAKAEKIRKAVKRNPVKYKSKSIKVTVSIGGASTKEGVKAFSKISKRADDNVYKAKKRGRDRVVVD